MRRAGGAALALAVALIGAGAALAGGTPFEGAWFSITVPAGFAVEEVRPSGSGEGAEAIRLHAPDGRAAIFVHAPQWAAEAPEARPADGERLVAARDRHRGSVTTSWRLFAHEQTGHRRKLRIVADSLGPTLIVSGLEYADRAALAQWHSAHVSAIASIERYAD